MKVMIEKQGLEWKDLLDWPIRIHYGLISIDYQLQRRPYQQVPAVWIDLIAGVHARHTDSLSSVFIFRYS